MPVLSYRGFSPRIADGVFIAPTAVIAGDVTIEAGASVWFGAVIRGDSSAVRIGPRTNIQDNCTIHTDESAPCIIGADCSIGHGAIVHGATLGDRVLVGMHATVLSGARLGDDVIVGSSALVAEGRHIEPGQLVLGVPGRPVRATTPVERERVMRGCQNYQRYAEEYGQAVKDAHVRSVWPGVHSPD